jgi:hypothetical protein
MLHPRIPLILGLSVSLFGLSTAKTADTPEQARARAEMRQRIAALDAGGSPTTPVFPAVPPPSGQFASPAAPTASAATANIAFPTVPPPSMSPSKDAAFPSVPPPSPAPASPASSAGFPAVPPPSSAPALATVPIPTQPATDRAQQQSEAKTKAALEAAKKAGKAPASAYATPTNIELPKAVAGKEGDLQELLRQYKANQVTPEEYQKKRAEILARP